MRAYRELLEQRLADEAAAERYDNAYLEALSECRGKLPERSEQALAWRYEHGLSFEGIAERLDMTRAAAEKLLSRVRQSLRECIEARLAES
jgi:RNA polymerase sigma-70 factor (ECF subfamily)